MGINRYKSTCTSSAVLVNKYIGTAYDHVKNVSDNIEDVKTVADALGEDFPEDGLDTLVDNIDDVVTVANNLGVVTTVANISNEVVTVAGIEQEIIDVPSYTAQAIDAANAAEQDADRAEAEAARATTEADRATDAADTALEDFEATFRAQFVYKRIGNISDVVGQQLPESDKLNSYQYPDDSGEWYGPVQVQVFPITIPTDPSSDDGWALVNALTVDNAGLGKVTADGSTTPRTLSDRFSDVINVKDFGAVGDGVTDDTAAFKAALLFASPFDSFPIGTNFCNSGYYQTSGGTVYVPNGKYRLTENLYLNHGVSLIGQESTQARWGSSTVQTWNQHGCANLYYDLPQDAEVICLDTVGFDNTTGLRSTNQGEILGSDIDSGKISLGKVVIRNITISMDEGKAIFCGLRVAGSPTSVIENVAVVGRPLIAIMQSASWAAKWKDIFTRSSGRGLHIRGANAGATFENCYISGFGFAGVGFPPERPIDHTKIFEGAIDDQGFSTGISSTDVGHINFKNVLTESWERSYIISNCYGLTVGDSYHENFTEIGFDIYSSTVAIESPRLSSTAPAGEPLNAVGLRVKDLTYPGGVVVTQTYQGPPVYSQDTGGYRVTKQFIEVVSGCADGSVIVTGGHRPVLGDVYNPAVILPQQSEEVVRFFVADADYTDPAGVNIVPTDAGLGYSHELPLKTIEEALSRCTRAGTYTIILARGGNYSLADLSVARNIANVNITITADTSTTGDNPIFGKPTDGNYRLLTFENSSVKCSSTVDVATGSNKGIFNAKGRSTFIFEGLIDFLTSTGALVNSDYSTADISVLISGTASLSGVGFIAGTRASANGERGVIGFSSDIDLGTIQSNPFNPLFWSIKFDGRTDSTGYRMYTGVPNIPPNYVGEELLDTINLNFYKAIGLSGTDWKLMT
ncbi:coil containing protein [Vibrio phage 1.152.O._10N.222.46.E1]|uniref:Coil containing protein n=1 Tax=Vibrio phage 1.152.O._10N.222.46.E1 TaxID=1881431 RepID=A0A2I7RB92_9CAUD|nr:coil containing protein [Vibrio phage 1.152.O._10N.222.46.E1]